MIINKKNRLHVFIGITIFFAILSNLFFQIYINRQYSFTSENITVGYVKDLKRKKLEGLLVILYFAFYQVTIEYAVSPFIINS